MSTRLIIEENTAYEIDEDCQARSRRQEGDTDRKEIYRQEKKPCDKKREQK